MGGMSEAGHEWSLKQNKEDMKKRVAEQCR